MVYFDYGQNRYVCSRPTLIPDIRAHVANWNHYRRATGVWPVLSILTFLTRFALLIVGVAVAIFCGVMRRGWTSNEYYLISIGATLPIILLWYLVERAAWNHDLRTRGLASNGDIWGLNQFPPDEPPPRHRTH